MSEKKVLVRDCRKQGGTLNVRFKDDEGGLDFFSILPESAEEYYRNMDPEVFAKLLVFDLIGDSANDEYIEKNWVFTIPCSDHTWCLVKLRFHIMTSGVEIPMLQLITEDVSFEDFDEEDKTIMEDNTNA